MSLEQFAFDPFSIMMFLYSMSLFEGKTSEEAKHEVKSNHMSDIQSIIINLNIFSFFLILPTSGHKQISVGLCNRLRLLAHRSNHQFRLGKATQSSDLCLLRIAHLDNFLSIYEGNQE